MNRVVWSVLILAALVAAGIGGYRIGRHDLAPPWMTASAAGRAIAQIPSGPVIYYQDPDGKPLYSAEPKSTADGRAYRAVHASEDISFDGEANMQPEADGNRKVLYYRNPMGLPDVSKTPKKDGMGMNYIPVYEGDR